MLCLHYDNNDASHAIEQLTVSGALRLFLLSHTDESSVFLQSFITVTVRLNVIATTSNSLDDVLVAAAAPGR